MPIDEASVKIRTGDPVDDDEDMGDDVWAGVAPFRLSFDNADPDAVTRVAGRVAPPITARLTR